MEEVPLEPTTNLADSRTQTRISLMGPACVTDRHVYHSVYDLLQNCNGVIQTSFICYV
jgi:hypothetical protein